MTFPYEDKFRIYCKQQKKLADSTISLACSSISTFWDYYSGSLDATEANVENVTTGDIPVAVSSCNIPTGIPVTTL